MFYDNAQSTVFTMLEKAARGEGSLRADAVERFCQTYSEPLIDFLCISKRIDRIDAEEIVQSFWSERFLAENGEVPFLVKYLEKKETQPDLSLRKYLAKSLSFHFLTHARRKSRTQAISMDALEGWEPVEDAVQQDFDVVWANRILMRAIEIVRLECSAKGQPQHWTVFEAQALRPALFSKAPVGYAELAKKYAFRNPKAVSNVMQTMVRKFHRVFRTLVNDYAPSDLIGEESESGEIEALFGILAKPGHLLLKPIESNTDWSCGFEVQQGSEFGAGLQIDLLNDASRLFSTQDDLSAGWLDLCQQPLSQWLLESDACPKEESLERVLHESTSAEICDLVRSRAKSQGRASGMNVAPIPQEFFAASYLLAIAAAKVRLGITISTQSADGLANRAKSTLSFKWLKDSDRNLLSEFASTLQSGD